MLKQFKTLFLTTALVTGFGLSTTAYGEEQAKTIYSHAPITARIGGVVDTKMVLSKQKESYRPANYSRSRMAVDPSLYVNAEGISQEGLKYGGTIELKVDPEQKSIEGGFARGREVAVDQAFIYVHSNAGNLHIGAHKGAADLMHLNTATFARGAGGITAGIDDFINTDTDITKKLSELDSLETPRLYSSHLNSKVRDANKITFYSPEMTGFQFGVSYTFNDSDVGGVKGFATASESTSGYKNILSGGIKYTTQVEQSGVSVSLVAEHGKNKLKEGKSLNGVAGGIAVTMNGFTVGGSYGRLGKLELTTQQIANRLQRKNTHYWDAGIAYDAGLAGTSITYFNSRTNDTRYKTLALDVDYKLAAGLTPYANLSLFNLKRLDRLEGNKGHVIMAGLKLVW